MKDSCLQEKAFALFVDYNYQFLKRNGLLEKVGTKSVDGFGITTEGLLAACHLGGNVSVYDYIINRNRENRVILWAGYKVQTHKKDAYGTKIQDYFKLFDQENI